MVLKTKTAAANLTQAQKEALGEFLSGSYIEFKANDKYTAIMGSITENGYWKQDENNTAILTKKGKEQNLAHSKSRQQIWCLL